MPRIALWSYQPVKMLLQPLSSWPRLSGTQFSYIATRVTAAACICVRAPWNNLNTQHRIPAPLFVPLIPQGLEANNTEQVSSRKTMEELNSSQTIFGEGCQEQIVHIWQGISVPHLMTKLTWIECPNHGACFLSSMERCDLAFALAEERSRGKFSLVFLVTCWALQPGSS